MQNTVQNKAYQRGLKAASIWKNSKSHLMRWDAKCVAWATRYHIPKWVGHLPVIAGIVLFLSGVLLGGVVLSVIMLFVAALLSIMLGNSSKNATKHTEDNSSLPPSELPKGDDCLEDGYRNGYDGYGYYFGGIKIDD
ncbi:hypothetical protein [Dickeya parazeae]|uniref:hypothetical protein n=1 Tax=Dickeya parazeae TaxID=2893572 RepID=UPI001AECAD98|nr:hypothetical protein [Dickeya parazeae]MBP2834732.1 hypothetical protein [Dickeya parazeae]